jgi:Ca2+-binding RTX toxin-like protein
LTARELKIGHLADKKSSTWPTRLALLPVIVTISTSNPRILGDCNERKGGWKMRRTTLLLVAIGCLLVIFSGVAVAVSQTGTNTANTPSLGPNADKYAGGGGNDTINGKQGDDFLFGDHGNSDTINGGVDNDFINSADGTSGDSVIGSGGTDTCVIDQGDSVDGTPENLAGHFPASTTTCEDLWVVG